MDDTEQCKEDKCKKEQCKDKCKKDPECTAYEYKDSYCYQSTDDYFKASPLLDCDKDKNIGWESEDWVGGVKSAYQSIRLDNTDTFEECIMQVKDTWRTAQPGQATPDGVSWHSFNHTCDAQYGTANKEDTYTDLRSCALNHWENPCTV